MRETMLASSAVLTGAALTMAATRSKLTANALGEHRRMVRFL